MMSTQGERESWARQAATDWLPHTNIVDMARRAVPALLQDIERLDAAVASLTAERDVADIERDIARKARFAAESGRDEALTQLAAANDRIAELEADARAVAALRERVERAEAEAARLREEKAAIRTNYKQVIAHVSVETTDANTKCRRLEAALGRARAALRDVVIHAAYDCPSHAVTGFKPDCDACFAKNFGNPLLTPDICAALADPEGKTASEYVEALEAEHAEVELAKEHIGYCGRLVAVHAVVEELKQGDGK